jgi:two-component system NtrC family sensor kinase
MKKLTNLITFITFSTTILGVLLVSSVSYFLIKRTITHHQLAFEKQNTKLLYEAATYFSQKNEYEHIQKILDGFVDNEFSTVAAVRIYYPTLKHFYFSKAHSLKSVLFSELSKNVNLKTIKSEVIYKNKKIAELEIVFSTEHFSKEIEYLKIFLFFITFILSYIVPKITITTLNKLLVTPIAEIADQAEKVRFGNYELRFKPSSYLELNALTESFNESIRAIQNRDRLLRSYNDRLEELVEQRTKERDEERIRSYNASKLASLGEMASTIAHEINNPLTVISGYSTMIKNSLNKEEKIELAKKANKIHENSMRIAKIIKGLKTISRDGENDPPQKIKISELVEDISSISYFRLSERKTELSFEYQSDLEATINVTQLGQVIVNLINNSIDAIENLDEKWIRIKFEKNEDELTIKVTDSGKGIPAELVDKLMTPFFTTKELGKGTGLGLSLCKKIINQHGGTFFYNQKTPNTQFVLNIPQIA